MNATMTPTINSKKPLYIFAVLALLIIGCNYTVHNLSVSNVNDLTFAIDNSNAMIWATLIDLTLVMPASYYFLIARKQSKPLKVLPVAIGGFWLAYYILPNHNLEAFQYIKYAIYGFEGLFILIEAIIAIYLLKKLPAFIRNYRYFKQSEPFQIYVLRKTFEKTFGYSKLANYLVLDFSAIYYGLLSWRKRKNASSEDQQTFTFHQNTGYFGFFLMLVHAMLIEIIAVHLLVAQWRVVGAWIITVLDIYTLFFIIADYQAIRLSPIVYKDNRLLIQIGIRRGLELNLSNIKSIQSTKTTHKNRKNEKYCFYITLPEISDAEPAYEIELFEPEIAYTPFGKREITKIYASVDDKQKFYDFISEKINNNHETN